MTPELHVLNNLLQNSTSNTLWCADENVTQFLPEHFSGSIISNRFDIIENAKQHKINGLLNDFDLTAVTLTADKIIFRIAKEKHLNQHIIKQGLQQLGLHLPLYLLGYKNEGILSLKYFIEEHFSVTIITHKYKAQLQCLEIRLNAESHYDIDRYTSLSLVENNTVNFFSKPGVFGWNKIDQGSTLMMDNFAAYHPQLQDNIKLLDLGCGYGYLSLRATAIGAKKIDASDNNITAIKACQANFDHYGITGEVFADNHGQNCQHRYDIILCNPPFHQGFDHHKPLIHQFIKDAYKLLKSKGEAWFVVNQFIGIEKIALEFFSDVQLIEKKNGFKVLLFKKT